MVSAMNAIPWIGTTAQLIDVGVKNAVDEANTRTFVRILVWKFDMNFPKTSRKRSCRNVLLARPEIHVHLSPYFHLVP